MSGFEHLPNGKSVPSRTLSLTEKSAIKNNAGNRKSLELLKKVTRGRSNEIRNITVSDENFPQKLPYKGKNKSAEFLYEINSRYNDTVFIGKNEKTGKLLAATAPTKNEITRAEESNTVKSEHGNIEVETALPLKKNCFTVSADLKDRNKKIISVTAHDKRLNEQTEGMIGEVLAPYSSKKDKIGAEKIEALEKSFSGIVSAELHGICETARSSLARSEQLEQSEENRAKRVINSVIFQGSGDDFFEFLRRKRGEEETADAEEDSGAEQSGRDVIGGFDQGGT